jgi:hypothetical protein
MHRALKQWTVKFTISALVRGEWSAFCSGSFILKRMRLVDLAILEDATLIFALLIFNETQNKGNFFGGKGMDKGHGRSYPHLVASFL